MSFFSQFFDIDDYSGHETQVLCPFNHYTMKGLAYKENTPSAHVNTEKQLFHCKACNKGHNERTFIKEYFKVSVLDARKIQALFQTNENIATWRKEKLELKEVSKRILEELGISKKVIQELELKTNPKTNGIAFPVFVYSQLCDIRTYNPNLQPKVISRRGATTGFIIPYDIWRMSDITRTTIICAGEKDMAIARSQGLNAITITGGEQALPKMIDEFKDRHVIIAYDNDNAGRKGARKLATHLQNIVKSVKVCTEFHSVCKGEGEDISDFFNKYKRTKKDLIAHFESSPVFEMTEEEQQCYELVPLMIASKPANINKMLQSNVQVVAVAEDTYLCPSAIEFKKGNTAGQGGKLVEGEVRTWELDEYRLKDILHLVDNNLKEEQIKANQLKLAFLAKEKGVIQKTIENVTIHKAFVTDLFETSNTDSKPMEFTVYSINKRLESGGKYKVTYKLVPHPYKGQQLIMIATDAEQANDSVTNFVVDDTVKESLDHFISLEGSVRDRIKTIVEKAKGIINYNGNNTLIETIDLNYHTPLELNFGFHKNMRAYLDTIIVSESRLGKSSTAEALRKTYGLGAITSLAGNSATVAGLIGGSNKAGGSFQTRAGLIPQNHKGMIIFEEFGKSHNRISSELTDVRSSNEVRISRVSGTVSLPALVRMIALTNVKSNKEIKSIASYPNGISIISELVPTAEDIARYDLIVILPDKGSNNIDPLWYPEAPFPERAYKDRIRWVWSRTVDQIIISKETTEFIVKKANQLNEVYACHIKIFGTECWKKITRLSTAIACYLVSTDETYEKVYVEKEHVNYAVGFLIDLYDNSFFKLKEFVDNEKRYSEIDAKGVAELENIYIMCPGLILHLEQVSETNKQTLGAATGLDVKELNQKVNLLVKNLFIKFTENGIVPTERFRLGVRRINRAGGN